MRPTIFVLLFLSGCSPEKSVLPYGDAEAEYKNAQAKEYGPTQKMVGMYSIGNEREDFTICGPISDSECYERVDPCWFRYSDKAAVPVHRAVESQGLSDSGSGAFKMTIIGQRRDTDADVGFGHLGAYSCEIRAQSVLEIYYFDPPWPE